MATIRGIKADTRSSDYSSYDSKLWLNISPIIDCYWVGAEPKRRVPRKKWCHVGAPQKVALPAMDLV